MSGKVHKSLGLLAGEYDNVVHNRQTYLKVYELKFRITLHYILQSNLHFPWAFFHATTNDDVDYALVRSLHN